MSKDKKPPPSARLDVHDITDSQIEELRSFCLEHEVRTKSLQSLTPRTRLAAECLGFTANDLSSRDHHWQCVSPSSRRDVVTECAHKVEQFMFWFFLIEKLQSLNAQRAKVVAGNLLHSDSDADRQLVSEMKSVILLRSNEEIERFVARNKRRLNQLFNEQRMALAVRLKDKERAVREREKERRKEQEHRERERAMATKREREAERRRRLRQQQLDRDRERAMLSMKWKEDNARYLEAKRFRERQRQQSVLKQRHRENEELLERRRAKLDDGERRRSRRRKQLKGELARHRNQWIDAVNERRQSVELQSAARRKRHEQKLFLLQKQRSEQHERLLQRIEFEEERQRKLQRSKSEQLLARSAAAAMHRNRVKRKNTETAALLIAEMVSRQKEADRRRAAQRLEREKEAAMKRTMYALKQTETTQRMQRMARAKQFEGDRVMERFRRNDARYRQSRGLRDAVLAYKLRSGDQFKHEKAKQMELSRKLVDDAEIEKLEKLIARNKDTRFGIQPLDIKLLEQMLAKNTHTLSQGTNDKANTHRSGAELLTQRMRKRMAMTMR